MPVSDKMANKCRHINSSGMEEAQGSDGRAALRAARIKEGGVEEQSLERREYLQPHPLHSETA